MDILKIKYLLCEGVNLKKTNHFVDNCTISGAANSCSSLLEKAVQVKGKVAYYINPNLFRFRTEDSRLLLVESDKSIHMVEGKEYYILISYRDIADKSFKLLHYDRV
jgi:hypothetical protein